MLVDKFDPAVFFQRPENIALRVAAREVFGLLRRTLNLPASWAALVTGEAGDHRLVPAGGVVDSGDADEVLFLRVTPVDVAIDGFAFPSRDGFSCNANVSLRLGVVAQRGEIVAFRSHVLGSRRVVQVDGLIRLIKPVIQEGLTRYSAENDAASFLSPAGMADASKALGTALAATGFTSGLSLHDRPVVSIASPDFEVARRSRAEADRQRAEHEAQASLRRSMEETQQQHLDQLVVRLSKVEGLTTAAPNTPIVDVIQALAEHQKRAVYDALFAADAEAGRTRWVVVALGDELVVFDAVRLENSPRRVAVNGRIGPIRSVTLQTNADGTHVLWLGAQRGVYRMPLDASQPDAEYAVETTRPLRGGFNASCVTVDTLTASHSELGVRQWPLSVPDSPVAACADETARARSVRHARFVDGAWYCAVDDRVIAWSQPGRSKPDRILSGFRDAITALACHGGALYVGTINGDVFRASMTTASRPERIHTGAGRPVESIAALDTRGVTRLVFTDTSPRAHCIVPGESYACRFEAGGQTLRRVAARPDLIVAMNEPRDRLIVWNPTNPDRPSGVIPIAATLGRSVQDVCLV